jgi:hypothetical protein
MHDVVHVCMINHVRFGLESIIVKAHRVNATKSDLDYEMNPIFIM